jgi:hypothetical protein
MKDNPTTKGPHAHWFCKQEIPHHDEIRADLRRFVSKMSPTA